MTSEDILESKLKQIDSKNLTGKSHLISEAQVLGQNQDTKNQSIDIWYRLAQSSAPGEETYVQSINAISQLYLQLGKFDSSLSVIEDSLEYTHNDKCLRQTQCLVLDKLGRLEEAEKISAKYDLSHVDQVIGESITQKEEHDREKALIALKNTSNRFLGIFGLNTDMLNINQGEDGNYRFNINK
ncbi:hypothetical protein J056_001334 [Wallemia ichthyophaga EXF-994]|uniref:Uncharacterized protein n=1 Tax=Wallemia ichthyophaga (strain EXF-994 / CBS 113033) TaxID=1299270 RepID=R9ACD5_WALI9|nr:uncharacterized protein J056_001334 [Wallemia ichthyophaga EXF-994]EOQ99792.1 hypothetical protein J056_001334 [Wallemia ichthyophaga EXF-994]TIB30439.1 hypothetical protein E3P84_03347 [Wallemia ichthyophaga]TIB44020.1 hypothetical protein E3P83_00448 [Wallemia ichthyophaga]